MPPVLLFLTIIFTFVVISTILMVLLKVAAWWGERHAPVSGYIDNGYDDMSSSVDDAPPSAASSLETDRRADRQTAQVARPSAEQLLTLYKLMRAAGIGREDAQAAFKEAGLPLNNNVWSKAAPQLKSVQPSEDDDVLVTPFAGRRTRASYYSDEPELEYKEL